MKSKYNGDNLKSESNGNATDLKTEGEQCGAASLADNKNLDEDPMKTSNSLTGVKEKESKGISKQNETVSRSEENTCGLCAASGCSKRCSRCKDTFYCSKECQKQDWKRHKSNCMKPKDARGKETKVVFYLDYDNPLPYFSYSQLKPGGYICLVNPVMRVFMDGTAGIRIDEPQNVKILDIE